MKTYKILYLCIMLLMGVYACGDKGDDDPQPQPNPDETITVEDIAKEWEVSEAEAGTTELNVQNVKVNFTQGGQYTLLIPGLDTFGSNGNWSLSDDGTTIILDDGSIQMNAKIVEIEDKYMTLEFISDNYKGQAITYRIHLSL